MAFAAASKRNMTRTLSHNKLLSVGAWMVVSSGTINAYLLTQLDPLPFGITQQSLIEGSRLITLMVFCNTDFFGNNVCGKRANAWKGPSPTNERLIPDNSIAGIA